MYIGDNTNISRGIPLLLKGNDFSMATNCQPFELIEALKPFKPPKPLKPHFLR